MRGHRDTTGLGVFTLTVAYGTLWVWGWGMGVPEGGLVPHVADSLPGGCEVDTEAIIEQMVQRLVEQFHPNTIILFGSRATGVAHPASDVDLLVVMPEVGDRRALRVAMRRAVNGMGLAKDILVLTGEEFATKRHIPGTIAYPADREGKVLYAA